MRLVAPAPRGAPAGPFHPPAAMREHLPLAAPAVLPELARRTKPAKPGVLVVEDEPAIRFLICDVLEAAGFEAGEAADADQALERLSTDKAYCRVLVTDLNLGRGPDGLALADAARGRNPALRVLYVTGTPERVPPWRTMRAAECVLGKPFRCAELVATVRWLMAVPAGPSGPA
ncbi:MAG: response regulator [Acetobacteraceae bacterium]|nr:response regulator [Acetobacteraceae bacterium]